MQMEKEPKLEPRFDRAELEALNDQELLEHQQFAESNGPGEQKYIESDYQMMLDEIKERFKSRCEAEARFSSPLTSVSVDEVAPLVELESPSATVQVMVRRKPAGEIDQIELEMSDRDTGETIDRRLITQSDSWVSRAGSSDDFSDS